MVQQQIPMKQKVQRKIEVPQVLEQIMKSITDGMEPQISQTEVMKNIVHTARDEPDTWSPEADGENALEENRIIESDDRYADGWEEVKRQWTRTSQRKPSKSNLSGRTTEGAGKHSKGNKVNKEEGNEEMPKQQVSQINMLRWRTTRRSCWM